MPSLPNFSIDLFKGFLDTFFDLVSFFAEGFELAEVPHPGPFLGGCFQFVLDRFGDELAQRDAPLGRHGLGPAKHEVGNFKRRFHVPILPYLWELPLHDLSRPFP
jgi:hypothetical protein